MFFRGIYIIQLFSVNKCQDPFYIPGSNPRHEVLSMAKQAGLGTHPGFPSVISIPPPPLLIKNKQKRTILFDLIFLKYTIPGKDPSTPLCKEDKKVLAL